jgi:LPXTG-motif cell wall-anchored protein
MNWKTGFMRVLLVLAVGVMFLVFALGISAQVETTQTTTTGHPTQQVSVERAEVVHVSGNDLVVKMEDGTIRHIANVPESARVDVDGQELGIHDLKPGMKLQRTITTTTTPKTITTTQTVTGKIWNVQPPNSVILTLEDGKNQRFTIPKGQTFNVNGREVDAWHLRKGMTVSATKVTEQPATVVEKQRQLTGSMPPPPPAPAADQPILVAVIVPVATPAAEQEPAQEAAPQQLPKTGSELPLLALLGCLSLAGAAGSRLLRKFIH